MAGVTVRVLGSGDAFGSGGRFQACYLVRTERAQFLIDCGATALVAMRRFEVDVAAIDAVLLSHLHGDHFGGLPFVLLYLHYVAKRQRPLIVAGPRGTEERVKAALAILFPGSTEIAWRFPIEFVELRPGHPRTVAGLPVKAFPVAHPSGAPSLGLRISCGDRVIAYSGDTEWTESLVPLARDADLFICECYGYDQEVTYHMNYRTVTARRVELGARRLLLTHLGEAMLARLDEVNCEAAEDGLELEV